MVDGRGLIGVDCFVVIGVLVKGVVRAVNGCSNGLDGRSIIKREVGLDTRRAMFGGVLCSRDLQRLVWYLDQ